MIFIKQTGCFVYQLTRCDVMQNHPKIFINTSVEGILFIVFVPGQMYKMLQHRHIKTSQLKIQIVCQDCLFCEHFYISNGNLNKCVVESFSNFLLHIASVKFISNDNLNTKVVDWKPIPSWASCFVFEHGPECRILSLSETRMNLKLCENLCIAQ